MMNKFELVIFDCDGVLVDSEKIANEVFANILNEEFDLSLNLDDMYRMFVGHSSAQCMKIIEEMIGKVPPAHIEQRYKDEINIALATSVMPVQGIEKALNDLTIPFGVASSGSHEKMQTTLGRTNLLPYFMGKLHSIFDVERAKPYPDVYLYAAKQLGNVAPSKCLVIEDSALGVQAGVSAGMTVFAYCELTDENKLLGAGAHHTFKDMGKLADEINRFTANTQ